MQKLLGAKNKIIGNLQQVTTHLFQYSTANHLSQTTPTIQPQNEKIILQQTFAQDVLELELKMEQEIIQLEDVKELIGQYKKAVEFYVEKNDNKFLLYQKKIINIHKRADVIKLLLNKQEDLIENRVTTESKKFEVIVSQKDVVSFIEKQQTQNQFKNSLIQEDIEKQNNLIFEKLKQRKRLQQQKNQEPENVRDPDSSFCENNNSKQMCLQEFLKTDISEAETLSQNSETQYNQKDLSYQQLNKIMLTNLRELIITEFRTEILVEQNLYQQNFEKFNKILLQQQHQNSNVDSSNQLIQISQEYQQKIENLSKNMQDKLEYMEHLYKNIFKRSISQIQDSNQ